MAGLTEPDLCNAGKGTPLTSEWADSTRLGALAADQLVQGASRPPGHSPTRNGGGGTWRPKAPPHVVKTNPENERSRDAGDAARCGRALPAGKECSC